MCCNGCRVLRKACTERCVLRDALQLIESPEAQANATQFLAKFYGRTGLLNLLSQAPAESRSEVCRSLQSDACGRVINPVDGSVGLYASGEGRRCEDAVQAVLDGTPLLKRVTEDGKSEWQFPVLPLFGSETRRHKSSSGSRNKTLRRRVKGDASSSISPQSSSPT